MNSENRSLLAGFAIVLTIYLTTPFVFGLSGPGVLDVVSAAVLIAACTQILFMLPRGISVISVAGIVLLAIAFNLVSRQYFQLQRFYPTVDTTYLLKEVGSLFSAYPLSYQSLLVFSAACVYFVLLYLASLIREVRRYSRIGVAAFLLLMSLGLQWGHSMANSNSPFSPIDSSPISHILRSAGLFPFGVRDVESAARRERDAVIRALAKNPDAALPDKYSAGRLAELLGYGKGYTLGVKNQKYPLYKAALEKSDAAIPYNIILVVLESVRASEMGLYGAVESATPFLDRLGEASMVVEKFYATSNYTVKSEHAILCSALDRMKGAPVAESPESIRTICLPEILKKEGYQTYWFHGNESSFYGRNDYLPKLGFDFLSDSEMLDDQGTLDTLGWGISDTDFFQKITETLATANAPFFAEILTLSNHLPFDYEWGIEFPEYLAATDSLHKRYRRGIYYTDKAFEGFYSAIQQAGLLKNSVLVITGDHGIWSFPDDSMPEPQKNEQMYRVPFILQVPYGRPMVVDGIHSHLDVTPTIVDLLNLDNDNDFVGQSIFLDNPDKRHRVIYSMSDNAVSYRFEDRLCIPSVQCMNSLKCTEVHEGVVSELMCYEYDPTYDFLQTLENQSFTRVKPDHDDRNLFDYTQIAVETGSIPKSAAMPVD